MLIGLGGVAQSGKDVVAAYLNVMRGWERTYMSQPLEQALLTLNPWVPDGCPEGDKWIYTLRAFSYTDPSVKSKEDLWVYVRYQQLHEKLGYDASKVNPEVRKLLQLLGTEVGRKMFGENVWVDYGFKTVDAIIDRGFNVSITGIRFANELDAIKERHGISVWVDRGLPPVNDHASDNSLTAEDFDVVVKNLGTIPDLYAAVEDVLATYQEHA